MSRVIVDPRIFSEKRLMDAPELAGETRCVVFSNPMQRALLEAKGLTVEEFEWELEDRKTTYRDWVDLCNRPLFVELPGGLRFDYSITLYPKRDAALLWLLRWMTERRPSDDETLIPLSDDHIFKTAVASRLGKHWFERRSIPSGSKAARLTLRRLPSIAKDAMKIVRARTGTKPLLYYRAGRELDTHLERLQKRWIPVMLHRGAVSPSVPESLIPYEETRRLLDERIREEPLLGIPYRFYNEHMVAEMGAGVADYLAESARLMSCRPNAFLLSSAGNMLSTAIAELGLKAQSQIGVIQHGSFAFLRSRRYEEDALFGHDFFCWYRKPEKYLPEHVARNANYVGYPKTVDPLGANAPQGGRVLIAPAQRFCLFDGLYWRSIMEMKRGLGEDSVSIRLHHKDSKMAFFGEPNRSLEEDIRNADVVITDMSTIAVDAIALGRPAVVMDVMHEDSFYRNEGMFPVCRTPESVVEETMRLLGSEASRQREVDRQRTRFDEEIGHLDGEELTERITKSLR